MLFGLQELWSAWPRLSFPVRATSPPLSRGREGGRHHAMQVATWGHVEARPHPSFLTKAQADAPPEAISRPC